MILHYKPHSLIIQMNTREGDFYTHSAGVGQRGARWCVRSLWLVRRGRGGSAAPVELREGAWQPWGGKYRDHGRNHTYGMPSRCLYGQEKLPWVLVVGYCLVSRLYYRRGDEHSGLRLEIASRVPQMSYCLVFYKYYRKGDEPSALQQSLAIKCEDEFLGRHQRLLCGIVSILPQRWWTKRPSTHRLEHKLMNLDQGLLGGILIALPHQW